jgi:heme-degrading monooxygenase HmoA
MAMLVAAPARPTYIVRDGDYTTEINFFHTEERDQEEVALAIIGAGQVMAEQPGFIAVNVLASKEGTRICSYIQWQSPALLQAARRAIQPNIDELAASTKLLNKAKPRTYRVVYTDDRSDEGVSIISPGYSGAIFINEITTQPPTQDRLLALVIANNEALSIQTPGYRSANFHRSDDGERAVNYSLWDTEESCIEAISSMADQDQNLEETVEIANPDFRFYSLRFAAHV